MLKEILKKELGDRGLSSRDAAKVIGVSHTTIIRITRGETVDLDTVEKIACWMNVRPATLLNIGSPEDFALGDEIVAVLENNPRLLKVFSEAIKEIKAGNVDIDVIEDIASYATYKINMKKEQQQDINTYIKADQEKIKTDSKDFF